MLAVYVGHATSHGPNKQSEYSQMHGDDKTRSPCAPVPLFLQHCRDQRCSWTASGKFPHGSFFQGHGARQPSRLAKASHPGARRHDVKVPRGKVPIGLDLGTSSLDVASCLKSRPIRFFTRRGRVFSGKSRRINTEERTLSVITAAMKMFMDGNIPLGRKFRHL